jgi:hypothetical protein
MPKPVDKPKVTPTSIGDMSVYNYLVEVPVEQSASTPYNSTSVKLQLCIDAHAIYNGEVSGRHYEWARAGSVVVVDALDAPKLLEKRIKAQSCCSGSDNPVFQIIVD